MKASLRLEFLGSNDFDAIRGAGRMVNAIAPGLGEAFIGDIPRGPYVAEITWNAELMSFARRYLPSQRDYSKSNSKGSRGVMLCFIIESDRLYEVHSRISWRNSETYYAAVAEDGSIYRLKENEAQQWLNALSA